MMVNKEHAASDPKHREAEKHSLNLNPKGGGVRGRP
jgi:hypothetical protein